MSSKKRARGKNTVNIKIKLKVYTCIFDTGLSWFKCVFGKMCAYLDQARD